MFSVTSSCTILMCVLAIVVYGQEETAKKYADLCRNNTEETKHVIVPGEGCLLFVICTKEVVHGPLQCPPTTRFSMDVMYCDHAANVSCAETSERLLEEPDCKMRAVPGFCKNYTQCSNGQLVMLECNEGLVFSNTKLGCDYPKDLSPEDEEYCRMDV